MPSTRSVRSFGAHHHNNTDNRPPSPTLSATTHASIDFPHRPDVLVTRADLRASVQAYEHLLQTCKAYTNAMLVLSRASADFAGALGECSKVKGAHQQADKLQACSGLHYLMSNYSQVLADSFWKDFQCPLLESFDTYRHACNERQVLHEKQILEKSKLLKETEAQNMRLGNPRRKGDPGRDLNSFRRALAELQRQVDDLDQLKGDYYHEVLDAEQDNWEFIQSKVSLLVRSQIEISDRISSKGLSDPVLEPLLASIPDPFDSYGPQKGQDHQIISILQPSTNALGSSTHSPSLPEEEEDDDEVDGQHAANGGNTSFDNKHTRSHSLFGNLNYMDGREGEDDDHFLSHAAVKAWGSDARATSIPTATEAPTLAEEALARDPILRSDSRAHKRASSNSSATGGSADRSKHALSIIDETPSPDKARAHRPDKSSHSRQTSARSQAEDEHHTQKADPETAALSADEGHSDQEGGHAAHNAFNSADSSTAAGTEPEQDRH